MKKNKYSSSYKKLFAKKDQKALCPHCNAHLFIFLKDVYENDITRVEDVVFQEGQAPKYQGEIMTCAKCFNHYGPGSIILVKSEMH